MTALSPVKTQTKLSLIQKRKSDCISYGQNLKKIFVNLSNFTEFEDIPENLSH